MTVAELIKNLEKMPKDVEVCYFDTYTNEGWHETYEDGPEWDEITEVYYNEEDNSVHLF